MWSTTEINNSVTRLTDTTPQKNLKIKLKEAAKKIKYFYLQTTVEPCLFIYMMCIAISSLAVQNMHLEKSCRVNFNFGDDVCNRITKRNTTGLEEEVKRIEVLVAKVTSWKFPLQTGIPAILVLFVGAWSDKHKKRKVCMLVPMIGEIITNIGLLLATYYFEELSLTVTVLIEALPPALTGSYIIIFMGMYSFMSDRTSIENRTFRLGIVSIFVNLGTPLGTALSGIILRSIGFYGTFSLVLVLHSCSLLYGLFKLEDVVCEKIDDQGDSTDNRIVHKICDIFKLVSKTFLVIFGPRSTVQRTQILIVLVLYLLMVGPLYGDSQVAYLYAIRRFNFSEVEYSLYGALNCIFGLIGTLFCISILSKLLNIEDSAIGGIAGSSRICSCFVLAFAPTRAWYYAAPLFNIFSSTGLPAVRSIASKVVSSHDIAKVSALMGVMEALAPSIYSPTSNHIYAVTIETFPGAFYMFDAALTFLALGLYLILYIMIPRRKLDMNIDPSDTRNKEENEKYRDILRY